MTIKSDRIAFWDNLKGFLILLVVFGHLLELIPGGKASLLYKVIYLFHMPLFVFCSGYLSSYSPQKIVKQLLLPYLVMQVVLCHLMEEPLQFTTPCWLLWYLAAMIAWRMMIPFFDLVQEKQRPFAVAAAFVLAFLCGFDGSIGRYGALSRIICYLPWFLMGYYLRLHLKACPDLRRRLNSREADPVLRQVVLVLLSAAVLWIMTVDARQYPASWLYNAEGYPSDPRALKARIGQYAAAFILGALVLTWMPHRRCLLTPIGSASMYLYLGHPFLREFLSDAGLFHSGGAEDFLLAAALSVLFCAVVAGLVQQLPALRARWANRHPLTLRRSTRARTPNS